MGIDYSAWIGFGVEIEVDVDELLVGKYSGWSVEEVIDDILSPPDDTPMTDSGWFTWSFRESGNIGYGGDGKYFLVARSSDQGIGWEPVDLQKITDNPGDIMKFNGELQGPLEKLMGHPHVKVVGPARWIAAMWMH